MSTHGTSFTLRVLAGALIAAALMTAVTAAAADPAPVVTSDSFAPGWQDHAKGLIFLGVASRAGSDQWLVPPILARGRYVVINREGDKAELMPGYQFQVPSDASLRIKLWLPSGHSNLEALPVSDLPPADVPPSDHTGQL